MHFMPHKLQQTVRVELPCAVSAAVVCCLCLWVASKYKPTSLPTLLAVHNIHCSFCELSLRSYNKIFKMYMSGIKTRKPSFSGSPKLIFFVENGVSCFWGFKQQAGCNPSSEDSSEKCIFCYSLHVATFNATEQVLCHNLCVLQVTSAV